MNKLGLRIRASINARLEILYMGNKQILHLVLIVIYFMERKESGCTQLKELNDCLYA